MSKKINLRDHPSEFFRSFGMYVDSRNIAPSTINNYHVLAAALMRFEAATRVPLSVETFDTSLLERFIAFYRAEPMPGGGQRRRSHNTVCALMRCLRAFFNWCLRDLCIEANPFMTYSGSYTERYATPYYLTVAERDMIAEFDFSADSAISVQRDIFIFQCLTGCRVSDMMNLTYENVGGGYLEYIARKTAGKHPAVIRIPLHPRAAEIIQRYKNPKPGVPLLPFIRPQRYNYAIKEILTRCGITRSVSLLSPVTGEPVRRHINEVASSHMARRTFIGMLYNRVKDPNLISSLTGHADNSRAFARYRAIDDTIKRELIMLL